MPRITRSVQVTALDESATGNVLKEFGWDIRMHRALTENAQAFNDLGRTAKHFISVRLWAEDDPINSPSLRQLVAFRAGPGDVVSTMVNVGAIAAVYQQWLWLDSYDNTWRTSPRESPADQGFGPKTYWKDVAVYWGTSSHNPDSADVGGDVAHL